MPMRLPLICFEACCHEGLFEELVFATGVGCELLAWLGTCGVDYVV